MRRVIENRNAKQSILDYSHAIDSQDLHSLRADVECSECNQLTFPEGLNAYKKTPIFNQETIPKGVWALITVLSGKVNYVVDYLDNMNIELDPRSKKGVISPQIEHHLDVDW